MSGAPDSSARRASASKTGSLRGWDLVGILVMSAAVRVAFLTAGGRWSEWPADDNRIYHSLALGLLHGQPLSSRWPPLLPLVEAGLASVVGPSPVVAKAFVALVGMALPVLAALLACAWRGRAAGLVAGVLAAVDGGMVASSAQAMTEPLEAALLVAALLALPVVTTDGSRTRGRAVLAGVLLGLACLARPTGLVMLATVTVMLVARALRFRADAPALLRTAGLVLACSAACVAPWAMHASRVAGGFVVATTGGGSTLLGSNCDAVLERHAGWVPAADCGVLTPEETARLAGATESGADALLRVAALRDLREHPQRWPALVWQKLASFWGWGNEGLRGGRLSRMSTLAFTLLLPFILVGAWRMLLGSGAAGARVTAPEAAALVLATLALSLVFWGGTRMRQPVEPLLMAFAAAGLCGVVSWRPRSWQA